MKQFLISAAIALVPPTTANAATLTPISTEAKVLVDVPGLDPAIPPAVHPNSASNSYDTGDGAHHAGSADQYGDGTSSIAYSANLFSGGPDVTTYMQTLATYSFTADSLFDLGRSFEFFYNVGNISIYIESGEANVLLSYFITVDGLPAFDASYEVYSFSAGAGGWSVRVANQSNMSGSVTPLRRDNYVYANDVDITAMVGSVPLPSLGFGDSVEISVRMGVLVVHPQSETLVSVRMGDPNGVAPYVPEIAAVPLPAGIWMLGGALGGLGLARRRGRLLRDAMALPRPPGQANG